MKFLSKEEKMKIRAKKLFILLFSFVIIVSLSSCKKKSVKKETFSKSEIAFPVKIDSVRFGEISEYKTYPGIVKAQYTKVILPEVSGRIKKMYVEVGEKVKKGQLLFEIEDTLFKAQYEQAKSSFELSKIQLADAQKNYKRLKAVYEKNGISKAEFERAESSYKMAKENYKRAKALLDSAEFQFINTKVRAPFSGIITGKFKEEGDFINPAMGGFSQSAGVYTLESFKKVFVDIDVSESDSKLFSPGMMVEIISDNNILKGNLILVNKKVDPQSSTVRLRAEAENKDELILPGEIAVVRIHYKVKENAIYVKRSALSGNYVFVVKNSKAHKVLVKTGLINENYVEILSGLKPGEKVVVEGNYGLFDGAIIKEEKK